MQVKIEESGFYSRFHVTNESVASELLFNNKPATTGKGPELASLQACIIINIVTDDMMTPVVLAPSIIGISGCKCVQKWWANIHFSI